MPLPSTSTRIALRVEVMDGPSIRIIDLVIEEPVILDSHPECWACRVGWADVQATPIFGATPLQAIALAIEALPAVLSSHFPGCQFGCDGKPLFLTV